MQLAIDAFELFFVCLAGFGILVVILMAIETIRDYRNYGIVRTMKSWVKDDTYYNLKPFKIVVNEKEKDDE